MNLTISHTAVSGLDDQLSKPGLMKRLLGTISGIWGDYRRDQRIIWSSYDHYSMTRNIPRRVWRRHSALFLLMPKDGN